MRNLSTRNLSTRNLSTRNLSTRNLSTRNLSTRNFSTRKLTTRKLYLLTGEIERVSIYRESVGGEDVANRFNQLKGQFPGVESIEDPIVGETIYQDPSADHLKTGVREPAWKFARGGHGCGTCSASENSFFFRAGNPSMVSLETRINTEITEVSRPGCWINVIPAGRMSPIPEASSGCTCNFSIQASMVYMAVKKQEADDGCACRATLIC